jgi:hypothetical protein
MGHRSPLTHPAGPRNGWRRRADGHARVDRRRSAESYALVHSWVHNAKPPGMSFSTLKYRDVDVPERAAKRTAWNQLVLWPAWALLAVRSWCWRAGR